MQKVLNVKLNSINSVYDPDTFTGKVNGLPDWVGDNMKFRLYGVDTPERGWRAKCENEKKLEEVGRKFLTEWIDNGKKYHVDILGFDKYGGRYLVNFRIDDEDVAERLIEMGFAKPYFGKGSKPNWCN